MIRFLISNARCAATAWSTYVRYRPISKQPIFVELSCRKGTLCSVIGHSPTSTASCSRSFIVFPVHLGALKYSHVNLRSYPVVSLAVMLVKQHMVSYIEGMSRAA